MYSVFVRGYDDVVPHRWLPLIAGEMLLVAGAYQFSRWKRLCADMCRSPLAFVSKHDSRRGVRNALGAGMMHGAYCLGCCWAAMMVLVVVGLMNLLWMTILFGLFFVEKNWKHGRAVANVVGIGMTVLGAVILDHRTFLTAISN